MITPEQNKNLNALITHYRLMSVRYNARKRDFIPEGDKGIVCFLNNEGKERWECSEKIADFIQKNDGEVIYDSLISPGNYEPTPNTIIVLSKQENEIVKFIDSIITKKESPYLSFLKHIRYSAIKECKEVAAIAEYIQKASPSIYEMNIVNNWLLNEYGG